MSSRYSSCCNTRVQDFSYTGGDGISFGEELNRADEAGHLSGFTRLLLGTGNLGVLLIFDRGFVYIPRNIQTGANLSPIDWCRRNGVQTLWRFKAGEKAFHYNRDQQLLTEIPNNDDETVATNRDALII